MHEGEPRVKQLLSSGACASDVASTTVYTWTQQLLLSIGIINIVYNTDRGVPHILCHQIQESLSKLSDHSQFCGEGVVWGQE